MCSIIMTVMSTLSMSMCTGNSCPHRWLVDSEWSSICLSKIWCCSLTVLNNGCCIWSDYRPMWVHLPFRLCWEFISTDVLNTVCSFGNCAKFVPLRCTLYKLQSGSLIQLVEKRFNTGLARHSEISLLLLRIRKLLFAELFTSHVLFFSQKKSFLRL